MTKRQKQIIVGYKRATKTSLAQVYKTCSFEKTRAEYLIQCEMEKANGYGFKILGANCHLFTCAYLVDTENGTQIVYHTAYNKQVFDYVV